MPSDSSYGLVKLEQALEKSGCAICRLAVEHDESYLYYFAWEGIDDPESRSRLRASLGFCPRHTWLLYDLERRWWGDGLEIALLLDDAIQETMRRLCRARPGRLLSPVDLRMGCLACDAHRAIEATYLADIARGIAWPAFRTRYQQNGGLCLRHLRALLQGSAPSATAFPLLADFALEALDRARTAGDISRLLDALFGQEISGELTDPPLSPGWVEATAIPCPLCTWQREIDCTVVRDIANEAALRDAADGTDLWALCLRHIRALRRAAAEPGGEVAVMLYDRAARQWLSRIRTAREPPRGITALTRRLVRRFRSRADPGTSPTCPACAFVAPTAEAAARSAAGALLTNPGTRQVPPTSFPCLRHLDQMLGAAPPRDAERIAQIAVDQLALLDGELQEYIRKHRWEYHHEDRGTEQTSWIRATVFIAGERGGW
ncbi:MAG: hypothetical protein IRY83_06525 [Chloroflexi bacterium]|nr:hypothetical protein [Chloroflexota bacterium]